MAYVESFKRAMERARASVSYWDHKTLDHLQAAHDAEMKQLSKAEFHRGYESGVAARDADQWQLDRERARIIRKLDALRLNADGGSHHNLSIVCKAVYEPSFGWTMGACGRLRDRLIYLLGGDTILKEDGDGMARGDFERGTVPCDSVGARDVPEEAVVDECNFSGAESDMDTEDGDTRPAETPDEPSDHVNLDTQPITSEQREYADDYCYRGHFSAFKSLWDNPAETSEDANGTASNDDGTCPIAVQSPSITDELRKFAETFRYEWYDVKDGSSCYTTSDCPPSLDSVNMTDYINGIADRIEEQFARCCKLWERTATDTAQEVHDSMEAECNELARDVEMWRDRAEDMRVERDELQSKLQAISVLCEQDDG